MEGQLTVQSLGALEASGRAIKAAADFVDEVDQEKQAAAALMGPAVDLLKEAQLIEDNETQFALTKLASHDGAIEVVKNLASHIGSLKAAYERKLAAAGQGTSLSEKAAGTEGGSSDFVTTGKLASNSAPIVGRRAGLGERRPSDVAMLQSLGLSHLME